MTTREHTGESRYYIAADGLRLHLRDYDPGATDATPVVCLAGLTRNSDDFAHLAQALAFGTGMPRRVVAFDYRGRGLSDRDPDWRRYSLPVERDDILSGLAVCGIETAHFVGTSRGGLHIMTMATSHRAMIRSVVLNDIGPVLEPGGLARIKGYVGKGATPANLNEAIQLLKRGAGVHFTGLSNEEWRVFATTTFGFDEDRLGSRYDPALSHALDDFDLDKPLPDLWEPFDALRALPVLIIRGTESDLLSPGTLKAMSERWPGCETLEVSGQGHAPLLADSASIARVATFLDHADRSAKA